MSQDLITAGALSLEKQLKKTPVITVGDAASATGYHLDDAKASLNRLMERYDVSLKVTENGDLVYDFGKLHRRGEKTFAERWQQFKAAAWKVFVVLFKIWISVTLVVYFIIFVVLLIALVVASMSSDSDSKTPSFDFGDVFAGLFRSIFIWDTMTRSRTYHYETDARGYRYRTYDARPSVLASANKKKKKDGKGKDFVASVYDFVFGPPRYEPHPLANQQEAASFLRKEKGIVVKPEIIGLAGWRPTEADNFFTDVLVRFDGEAKVTDNGVLYGDFYELSRSKNKEADAPIEWYWDEFEAEHLLTGNKMGRNTLIFSMNVFNLSFATFFTYIGLGGGDFEYEALDYAIVSGLGFVPLVFSLLFFFIPAVRAFQVRSKRKKRVYENMRKRVMKQVFRHAAMPLTAAQYAAFVNENAGLMEALPTDKTEKILHDMVLDLDGEVVVSAEGNIVFVFERLAAELNEAEALRKGRGDNDLGKIVFDSGQ